MDLFQITLILTTLLCSLVAGFLFAFAVVVMPGIRRLSDHDFLRAFQVIDRVIQDRQPLFMAVWPGSIVLMLVSAGLGAAQLSGVDLLLMTGAAALYLLGVQLPTIIINVPLNNHLQTQDLASLNEAALQEARRRFEPRWIRWNAIRTVIAVFTAVLLIVLVFRL